MSEVDAAMNPFLVAVGQVTVAAPVIGRRSISIQPYARIEPCAEFHNVRRLCMAYIEVVPDEEWTDDELAELYPQVVDPTYKRVDNIIAVHSLNPRGLAAHQQLYTSAMASSATLRKVEREMIALVVSLENDCHY